ncbi:hypothetical protein ACBG85_29670 (plasmid) [Rhodococcus sp. NyZ502]|uniref:hypothetical protein n=1 Tax=Rhodococcus sp. NyZ502 TaxID=3242855 RepID=UPI003558D371
MNEVSAPGNALQRTIHYLFTLNWWKSMIIPLAFAVILAVVITFSVRWAITLGVVWLIVVGAMAAVEWRYTKTLREDGSDGVPT